MDNKINEIRRRISTLRAEMTLVEASIRDQVNRDLDCSEGSYRLMAMRAEVAELIVRWKAAGGGERLPTVRERLSRSYADRPTAAAKADKARADKPKAKPGHSNARV
ncbi:hypothetical protein [Bradyrhizobium viridifuturi]|uniref:hypothetical protein n=1 Tax=Bradyrhizobium viridifuturi TaxID=1654716 RepID=UPI00067E9A25|nr:hypothetical protein [Bradyrhizobium viridifuturi]